MTRIEQKKEQLRKDQAALKRQLMSRLTPVITQISRAMDESAFLQEVEQHIKAKKIPIRTSARIHRSLYVDYSILPCKKNM